MGTGPSSLKLNRRHARWLGVCAGIADWLDVPVTLVRVVFVICVLSWPTLIIGYFILYFCLDKDITPDKMKEYFSNASTAEHFRKLDYHKPIYKNERNKKIAGVCSGIADYFEVSPFAVRAVALISLFLFGPFTFWAYIICMFVFDPDPHATPADKSSAQARRQQRRTHRKERREQRHARKNARKNHLSEGINEEISEENRGTSKFSHQECTDIYNSLELRLREIEAYMTSRRFRLHCEINRI